MKAPKESDLYRPILDLLALRGVKAWRTNTGGARYPGRNGSTYYVKFGFPGLSDIAGVLPLAPTWQAGRALFCEVKMGRGKLTLEQAAFLADMERQGALCIVARSIGDVASALDAEGY